MEFINFKLTADQHVLSKNKPEKRSRLFVITFSCTALMLALAFCYNSFESPLPVASLARYKNYLHGIYCQNAYSSYIKQSEITVSSRPEQPLKLVLVHKPKDELESSHKEQMECAFHGNVDLVQKQNTVIKIEEIGSILKTTAPAHFVLIEGAPGIGKSTLCWQLCRLWSDGKLRHKWDLMVLVEIRDETTRKAKNVYDLLYHPDDRIRKYIAQEIEKRDGEGLFIIFDGYDELSDDQRNELSIFQRILVNRLLRKATVVVTTRKIDKNSLPSQFKQNLDQHIEIAGFNNSDIQQYISLTCGNNTSLFNDFLSYVYSHPFVFSLMYNPLHCTIVTELYIQYWQDGHKGFAPNTVTELYTALLLNLLRRHLSSSNQSADIEDLSDLPTHVYNNLMQLAELAENGLEERKYIFNKVPGNTLGLMVSVRQLYDIRTRRSAYMFLHLTLQEYLAAFYWSQQPHEKLRAFMTKQSQLSNPIIRYNECATNITDHWPVALFLAGFTRLDNFPLDVLTNCSLKNPLFIGSFCHMLFEAQREKVVLFANLTFEIPEVLSTSSFAIGYCVAKSDNTTSWYLTMYLHETPHNLQMLSNGLKYRLDWKTGPSLNLSLIGSAREYFEYSFTTYSFSELYIHGILQSTNQRIYLEQNLSSSVRPMGFQLSKYMSSLLVEFPQLFNQSTINITLNYSTVLEIGAHRHNLNEFHYSSTMS